MDHMPIVEPLSNGLSAMIVASGQDGDFTVVYTLMRGKDRLPGHRHQLMARFATRDAAYAAAKADAERRAGDIG